MKRARWALILMGATLCAAATACSGPPVREPAEAEPAAGSGWTRPPDIRSVRREGAGLVFAGQAEAGGRVVLRNATGAAYAAAADAQGRFEIRIATPGEALLLRPEIQVGQDAAESPDRLLILAGGHGPVAVLRAGGPARRLDDAPALGAVDSDGRAVLASGRAAPDRQVSVSAGGPPAQVRPDAAGRWSVLLGAAPGEVIRVDGVDHVWPGPGTDAGGDLQVDRAGDGWRVGWNGPGGARQWTWLPDAAPAS